jgi:hypothetical protein
MQLKFEQEYYRINQVVKPNNKRSIKGDGLQQLLKDIVDSGVDLTYSTKRSYTVGCFCIYNDEAYVCTTATNGIFDAGDWELLFYTPPITIGNLTFGATPTVGTAISGSALITGGTSPYTITTETGSVAGLTWSIVGSQVTVSGTPTTFGIENVSIQVTDINGFTSNLKVFTIEVWAEFINNTPQVVTSGDTFPIAVSGLPTVYGTGVILNRITLKYTSGVGGLPVLNNPDVDVDIHLYNTPSSGNVTDAVIYDLTEAYPQFATGSTPYTGNFITGSDSFSELAPFNTIGDWLLSGITGTVNSVTLLFKPI